METVPIHRFTTEREIPGRVKDSLKRPIRAPTENPPALPSKPCPAGRNSHTECFSDKTILFGFSLRPGLGFLSIRFIFIDCIKLIHVIR